MVGKAPLHLVCEFIGAAAPHILTVACLAFQKRDHLQGGSAEVGALAAAGMRADVWARVVVVVTART
jgi:hypothetical protein